MTTDLQRKIAFSMIGGLSATAAHELLRRVGGLEDFFAKTESELAGLAGITHKAFTRELRDSLLDKAALEATFVEHNKIKALFFTDNSYPARLKECQDAPLLIFVMGDCDLNARHVVGIVGTRHSTAYGISVTRQLVTDLRAKLGDVVIISGLAYGIDVAAHRASLQEGIPTAAVLAHGLKTIYPAEHRSVAVQMVKEGGCLITEYCSDARIFRQNFLARNRIIAGLCDCLVVVESDYRSGSLSTARTARDYNREVFAVPGRVTDTYSNGTNQLIKSNAAAMICNADDIIDQMGWTGEVVKESAKTQYVATPEHLKPLLEYIRTNPDKDANCMCVDLGLPYSTIIDYLFQLELDNRIISQPGGRYVINK